MHGRWRMTALTHHLIVGEGHEQHPGFLHFSTPDSSTTSALTIWARSVKCLMPLSLQCHLMGGGGLSGIIQREAERRKHSRQRLNFYLNSRYLKKKRGRQIKTGLPLPQSGALNSIKGRRRGLVSVRAPRDAANAFLWYSHFFYKEQWAGSHGGSEWSTVFSLEQTALQCIC